MCALSALILISSLFWITSIFKRYLQQKKLGKWNDTPKDLVVLHAIGRGKRVSHPSPFVVKVETFLRMANIKYETDFSISDAWGPKNRFPWISINGQHIADSELIIQYLKRKFNVNLNKNCCATDEELALAEVVKVMMNEHFFWGVPLYRFVYSYSFRESVNSMMGSGILSFTNWRDLLFQLYAACLYSRRSKSQGIGVHSRQDVEKLTVEDLRYLSTIIGSKKFLLGDEPSEYDCSIFGQLSQCMWGLPGSVYERVLNDELVNLKEYCLRMKDKFYPDWDQLLQPTSKI